MSTTHKIHRDSQRLAKEIEALRRQGKKIVFASGCYDIVHVGHVRTLDFARSQGDILAVGVNDDASVSRLKGAGRPILPLEQRLRVLAGLLAVDFVIPFEEDTPLALLEALRPDVVIKGGDSAPDEAPERDESPAWGGQVKHAPAMGAVSTRAVIQEILNRFAPASS